MHYQEENNLDPFLCDDCQHYGYCRKRATCTDHSELEVEDPVATPLQQMPIPLSDAEIKNWIAESKWAENAPPKFELIFREAVYLFQLKKYEEATKTFQMILALEHSPVEAGYALAACLFFLKDPQQAALILSQIIEPTHKEKRLRFMRSCEIQKRMRVLKERSFPVTKSEDKSSNGSYLTQESIPLSHSEFLRIQD